MNPDLLSTIGLSVVGAAAAAVILRQFRQPPLLGYILGGVLLGPRAFGLITDQHSVELISHIGLILLLFIIGLEIDLPKLFRAGRSITVLGFFQFPLCLALAYGGAAVFFPDLSTMSRLYIAAGLSLSSTMIVVKLLHDKLEISSHAGRLTVGVLVFQDVWAIALISIQPSLGNPAWGMLAASLGWGVALVLVATLLARTVLPKLFERIAMSPELTIVVAVAWCFAVAGAAGAAGLSREMGALVAGASMAPLAYSSEIVAKLGGIRDFFVCLFFVALGLQVPPLTGTLLAQAGACALIVLLSRVLVIMPLMRMVKGDVRHGALVAINLSQVSEFSLVLAMLGVSFGHIGPDVAGLVLVSLLLTALMSTYLIKDNHRIAAWLAHWFERGDRAKAHAGEDADAPDIFILGFHRVAGSLLPLLEGDAADLKHRLAVIDFNPETLRELRVAGVHCHYGDISHAETLAHTGLKNAVMVISSIPDTYLKGTSNLKLLRVVKRLVPGAKVLLTGESAEQAEELYREGADLVILPRLLAAGYLFNILTHDPLAALGREKERQRSVLSSAKETFS